MKTTEVARPRIDSAITIRSRLRPSTLPSWQAARNGRSVDHFQGLSTLLQRQTV
jgi:thioredoxin-like negative regulator of GroEL